MKTVMARGTAVLAITLLASSALVRPAGAQEIVRQWFGDAAGDRFGNKIALVGDVDGDGFVDLGVSAPYDSSAFLGAGMIRLISGADGSVIRSLFGDRKYAGLVGFGHPIGDVDHDGHDDILARETIHSRIPWEGRVFVFSGNDGSILLSVDGTSTDPFSGPICGTGDVDGDGVPDFAVGNLGGSFVDLRSGATGSLIRTLNAGDPASTYFGSDLLNPGDLDGDGVADLIVFEHSCYYPQQQYYYAFSGSTGAILWQVGAAGYCGPGVMRYWLDQSPTAFDDLNGDGVPDWGIGYCVTSTYYLGEGYLLLFSGKDGSLIAQIKAPLDFGDPTTFGFALSAAGDVDGDGVPDVVASDDVQCDEPGGNLFFFSGLDGTLLFHCHGGPSDLRFGSTLCGGVDADGDGRLDIYAGDSFDATNGTDAGAVTQIHLEPVVLDVFLRYAPRTPTRIAAIGGPPGNPVGFFVVDVNGTPRFDLIEFDSFDPSRRSSHDWSVPSGLTGLAVILRAYAIDGTGRVIASNDETITFP